jgi:serine/threonine-protein kinase GIN4
MPIDLDTSGSSNDHITPPILARNSLTDSPFLVQPYSTRQQSVTSPALDTPTQRHLESEYDRLLMATSGVKRVGKGYQSCCVRPILRNPSLESSKSPGRFFHPTRRPMPPPVSSEDKLITSSVGELGAMQSGSASFDDASLREDRSGAAKAVSRALKALVTGRPAVKTASRTH